MNKCNITSFVLSEVSRIRFGSRYNLSSIHILENYTQYLNCDDVNINICYPDKCTNNTITFTCTLAISAITGTINDRSVTFSVNNNVSNYVAPLTYTWTYNTDIFDLSSPLGQSTLTLTLKDDRLFNYLVTGITLNITDANGCTVTKTCYLISGNMQCGSYTPCYNLTGLTVVNKASYCNAVSGLVVIKKS